MRKGLGLMIRKDRKIEDIGQVLATLQVCDSLHVAFMDEDGPYVLPFSYGVDYEDGHIVFYIHTDFEGKKVELINKNNHVSIEADIVYDYYPVKGQYISCSYSSVVGKGTIQKVNEEDYDHAMDLIVLHYGYEGFVCDKELIRQYAIYKIILDSYSGRCHYKSDETL